MKTFKSSISDRITWQGFDDSLNQYFDRNGEKEGCGCSMNNDTECVGGFLCNCDASDEGDTGIISNKDALPITSMFASNVNSTTSIIVTGLAEKATKPTHFHSPPNCQSENRPFKK